jgi:hypothetical protein
MFVKQNIEKQNIRMIDKETPESGRRASGFYIVDSDGGFNIFHER